MVKSSYLTNISRKLNSDKQISSQSWWKKTQKLECNFAYFKSDQKWHKNDDLATFTKVESKLEIHKVDSWIRFRQIQFEYLEEWWRWRRCCCNYWGEKKDEKYLSWAKPNDSGLTVTESRRRNGGYDLERESIGRTEERGKKRFLLQFFILRHRSSFWPSVVKG